MGVTDRIGAVDLGGTHLRVAVVSATGQVIKRKRVDTPLDADRPDMIPALLHEVVGESPRLGVDRVVVGLPGLVDYDAQKLCHAPNIPDQWHQWLTAEWLSSQIGVRVSLANDADLAAVGEAWFGAARHQQDMFYVTVSTGVGGGAVLGRRLVRGRYSAGEIGHTMVSRKPLLTGHPATVERLGSGTSIAESAQTHGLEQRNSALANLARAGHDVAAKIWDEAIEVVSIGVVNMAWILSPQMVVIGGGVGSNTDLFLGPIQLALARYGPTFERPIEVVGAALGDDAALAGAAGWLQAGGSPNE